MVTARCVMRSIGQKIQLTLDCGQKEFGSTRCKQCGMLYVIGDRDDAKAHISYHKKVLFPTVKLPRGHHQKIIEERFDGSRIVELVLTEKVGFGCFARIAAVMNRDFGYDKPIARPTMTTNAIHSTNTTTSCEPSFNVPKDWRVFVYIYDSSQLAVGCCVVEELTMKKIKTEGYKVHPLIGGKSNLTWRSMSDEVNPDYSTIKEPLCGVRQLWVAQKYRRKGIATCLLNCILRTMVYGHTLAPSQVAFADPTSNGADFAARFTGTEEFLIY